MEPYTLLVIARTQSLVKRLQGALDAEQYLIRWVPNTAQALELRQAPSLLILDLPASGGARSVVWLKAAFHAPLLAISRGRHSIPNQADAVLHRPFETGQLVELIQTTLLTAAPHTIQAGAMSLDTRTRLLQINGVLYQLRPLGCQILALLMQRCGDTVPRDELFRCAWQTNEEDCTRALDVHISHLRRQIEPDPRNPALILTDRGIGYRLQPPPTV